MRNYNQNGALFFLQTFVEIQRFSDGSKKVWFNMWVQLCQSFIEWNHAESKESESEATYPVCALAFVTLVRSIKGKNGNPICFSRSD
jgi:hypothetical protein